MKFPNIIVSVLRQDDSYCGFLGKYYQQLALPSTCGDGKNESGNLSPKQPKKTK